MKNLIITFCNENNLGANLQAFALQEILKLKGPTELLNYDLKTENRTLERSIKDLLLKPINYMLYKPFRVFRQKNYNLTKKVKNVDEIEEIVKNYDNIFCGSDQVWNYNIVGSQFDIYSLNFKISKNAKRISYAASIGTNKIPQIAITKLQKILPCYSSVSVRESSAVEILNKSGMEGIKEVIDPTLLLSAKEWDEKLKINEFNNLKGKYIFIYYLDNPTLIEEVCNKISKVIECKFICYGKKSIFKRNPDIKNCKFINKIGPKEFVQYIKNSEYVITNSFHGMAFSIIYSKQFVTVLNGERGVRQLNLLKKLGIDSRVYNNNVEFLVENKIVYDEVQKELEKYKELSIKFIDEACDVNE